MASFASWATKIVVALALCVHPDGVNAFGKPLDQDLTEFPFASVSTIGVSCPLTDGGWEPKMVTYNIEISCDEEDDGTYTMATYGLTAYDMSGTAKYLSLNTRSAQFSTQIMMSCANDECDMVSVESQNAQQRAAICCSQGLEDCSSQTSVVHPDYYGATFKSCLEEFGYSDESATVVSEEYCKVDSPSDDSGGCDEADRCYYECGAEHLFPADGQTCDYFEGDSDLFGTDKDFACCMLDECDLDLCMDWEWRDTYLALFQGNCYDKRNLRAGAKLGAGTGRLSANFRRADNEIIRRTRQIAARASAESKVPAPAN